MKSVEVLELTDIWSKARGLISADKIRPVCFKTRWGIHTFFMKKPIDVVILDSQDRVVVIKSKLLPNRFFIWNPRYYKVFELPAGSMGELHVRRGDAFRYRIIKG